MNSNSSDVQSHPTKGDRIRVGLARAREEGKQIGRPRVDVSRQAILDLRRVGYSWSQIARQTGAGAGTVRRAFHSAAELPGACQNSGGGII